MPRFIIPTILLTLLFTVVAPVQGQQSLTDQLNSTLQTSHPTLWRFRSPVHQLQLDGATLTVDLNLAVPLNAHLSDHLILEIANIAHPYGVRDLFVRVLNDAGEWVELSDLLPPTTLQPSGIPTGIDPAAPDRLGSPNTATTPANGALAGKTVWLSAGHGWEDNGGNWITQRGNTNGLVEDFSNAEAVNYYLARYLRNAGADVWLVREPSMNTNEIIVDNDGGAYSETGTWTTSASPGYDGLTYRFAATNATTTATATWTPTIPEAGWYGVTVWYLHSANRPISVTYHINHAGGTTPVTISQEEHGQSWRYLGEFYFDAGTAGSVTLINQSADLNQFIIADAVRFGGGMGSIDFGSGTSGRPRWEESAWPFAIFQGYTAGTNDVTVRPLYAEWEKAKAVGEDAVYVSWHTNAGGGTGTETFIHNTAPTAGSALLQDTIHAELINDIRNGWDAGWTDRGQKSANFGELRELSTMPGVLLEIAFHDNSADANQLKEPAFRNLTARAVYQGIAKYYLGASAPLLPEPPTHLTARNTGGNTITLDWRAPSAGGSVIGDAATGYNVYIGTHGRAFADGIAVSGTSYTFTGAPNTTYFFRVTATNAGGESFPTATVAARTGGNPILIVDGFDRLDRFGLIDQYESAALGFVERGFIERINNYDYAVEHGTAWADCGYAFDGTTNEAIEAGDILLTNYSTIDWFTGEDSTVDKALSATERALLATYLDNGGALLISGAEIGWHLARPTTGEDPTFYNNYLKATYIGDDANSYDFMGNAGSLFAGISGSFDDGSQGYFDAEYPDRLGATGGSVVVMGYVGGSTDGAATAYNGSDFKIINMGFPLETITDPTVREQIICSAGIFLNGAPTAIHASDQHLNSNLNRNVIITLVYLLILLSGYQIIRRSVWHHSPS